MTLRKAARRYGWLLVAIFLALGAAGLWTVSATHEVSLDAAEIQRGVDAVLPKAIPLKGPIQALIRSAEVKALKVALDDGKAAFAFSIDGTLQTGKRFDIEASALGVPKYDAGGVYFDPERIEIGRIAYDGQSAADIVSRVARNPVAGAALRALVGETPQKADDWAAKAVDSALRHFLATHPVYRLQDDAKGYALKSALEKVEIDGDRLNVSFSLWRLTTTAVASAFSLLIGLALGILILRAAIAGEDIDISVG